MERVPSDIEDVSVTILLIELDRRGIGSDTDIEGADDGAVRGCDGHDQRRKTNNERANAHERKG